MRAAKLVQTSRIRVIDDSSISVSIAVVIVCFNSGESLARCVTSVIGQTLQATRIIVVDNASTDSATQDVLSALPARVEQL